MDNKKRFNQISGKANDPEAEKDFRAKYSWYEDQRSASSQSLDDDYHEYTNFYHHITSLYLTTKHKNRTKLIIYDTESEKEEIRILKTPESLSFQTSITQLPSGELFCYGRYPGLGITLIIDRSYEIRILPSGTPCYYSSSVYFNNNIYCFGGKFKDSFVCISKKFDLIENRWNNLAQMPRHDIYCHNVIFNGNILISGYCNRTLLLYSPDLDSFSAIPYHFVGNKAKILINIGKLYLIECYKRGLIYESEDEYAWKPISNSIIDNDPFQVYFSYNKRGIYIATNLKKRCCIYKFDLIQKGMTELE